MKINSIKLPEKMKPYQGVLLFSVILLLSNIFWKYNVIGDESLRTDSIVSFWGQDISAPFREMANLTATQTQSILQFFGYSINLEPVNILRHTNGNAVVIIWACTGLKQAYIFTCIIAFYRGPWQKKLWFIPLGLIAIYLFNTFRIAVITASIASHPEWFNFLHLYFFKYIFYGIIFLMWVIWEEKICLKKQKTNSAD